MPLITVSKDCIAGKKNPNIIIGTPGIQLLWPPSSDVLQLLFLATENSQFSAYHLLSTFPPHVASDRGKSPYVTVVETPLQRRKKPTELGS